VKRKTGISLKSLSTTILGLATLLLVAGCATNPTAKVKDEYIFFPPGPEEPRLQFLASFSSEEELRGGNDNFASFVTGSKGAENPILKPYGIALRNGKFYICDTALDALLVMDLSNKKMIAATGKGEGVLRQPLNVSVDEDGSRYVVDSVRNQVVIYDARGQFQAVIGKKDEMKPKDVLVSHDRIYVADVQSHSVKVYDKSNRELLFSIPRADEAESILTRLFQPTNMALDQEDRLHVTDTGAFRVQRYSRNGKYESSFGKNGSGPGEFKMPKGVAVDHEGRIYVVDAANQVIQIFDKKGQLLMWFGEPTESTAGLDLPAKVIIDYEHVKFFERYASPGFKLEHLVIVTNQYGARKVSIYGFGQKKV
jgi:hypothetical protein